MELPKEYKAAESEPKWIKFWEENKIYHFDPDSKAEIFSIDTPPPTVSGKMHIGHSFSYSQQDFIVRFQRMKGKNIFYPFGTDNNGVATERLIEKMKGIKSRDMPREKFVQICLETLDKELRPAYIQDWKRMGMSCEWSIFYDTIDKHCQKISQRSFLELYKMGREYRKDAPTMWCPECHTGISQVECVDKELESFFNDIIFKVGSENLTIATTRPELLPACVAVFYHPDDKRYQKYNGKKAKVPLFDFEVPILPDERADPEKGTGIVMCCTFGDQTDMEWQKAHNLPIKQALTVDGHMTDISGKYSGLTIKQARKEIINDMKESGLLINQKPIKHVVNVHERCGTEIEFIKSKQWFIRYLDLKDNMLEWGKKINWYPEHMRNRYENWVKGLQWDWLISRQRYFGVPFPVWYCKKCDEIILAEEKDLPVDPINHKPKITKCPKCGNNEFVPETDVMDTWATSSLTPRLSIELMPKNLWDRLFPMSMRPQAHDIITFWLFNTTIKSNLHFNKNPWKDAVISGWALDPKGKKMSKSKGNTIEPQEIIKNYSADILRFWASGAKLGEDLAFQEKDILTANKTVIKLWNASKFGFMHLVDYKKEVPSKLEGIDRWFLSKLNNLIRDSTENFEKYEYAKVKADVEYFFYHMFCDNYMEIVKDRLYNPDQRGKEARLSAQYTLYTALFSLLKMFAPIMPFITEELYQLFFKEHEKYKSIHISRWPEFNPEFEDKRMEIIGDVAVSVVTAVRQEKTSKQKSLKEPVKLLIIETKENLDEFLADIKSATKSEKIEFGSAKTEVNENLKLNIEL